MPHTRASSSPREALIFRLPATTFALLLLFLSALDSFATILVLRRQIGIELNPLMRWLFNFGEPTFLVSKLLLTLLCAAWIVRRARHPYARKAALIGLAIYVPVVCLHIVNNFAPMFVG
jgi:hypothetical protein